MAPYKKLQSECEEDFLLFSNQKEKRVSFLKLFSFASLQDYFLVTFGVLAAVVSGFDGPVYMILYGDMANIMVYINVSEFNRTSFDNSTRCNSFTIETTTLR